MVSLQSFHNVFIDFQKGCPYNGRVIQEDNQNKNQNNKNNRQGLSFILIVTLVTTLLVMALYQFQGAGSDQEISIMNF